MGAVWEGDSQPLLHEGGLHQVLRVTHQLVHRPQGIFHVGWRPFGHFLSNSKDASGQFMVVVAIWVDLLWCYVCGNTQTLRFLRPTLLNQGINRLCTLESIEIWLHLPVAVWTRCSSPYWSVCRGGALRRHFWGSGSIAQSDAESYGHWGWADSWTERLWSPPGPLWWTNKQTNNTQYTMCISNQYVNRCQQRNRDC